MQKVHQEQDQPIQVHQSEVMVCPSDVEPGHDWYRRKHNSSGKPPQWINTMLRKYSGDPDRVDWETSPSSQSDVATDRHSSTQATVEPPEDGGAIEEG